MYYNDTNYSYNKLDPRPSECGLHGNGVKKLEFTFFRVICLL